jgi:hypothetical protein
MENRLYVGNLSDDVSAESLRRRFAQFGEVSDVHLAMDRTSGRMRGHAFVTMAKPADARNAREKLDGALFEDRPLRVNIAGEDGDRSRSKAEPRARITSQFRERLNMVYELDCSGIALVVRMFPEDAKEQAWRLEASVRSRPDLTASASAPTRRGALEDLAGSWQSSATTRVSALDWDAITEALASVRAI